MGECIAVIIKHMLQTAAEKSRDFMCSVCVWLPVRATLWHAANRTYVVFLWVGSVPIYTEQHSTVQPFSSSATDAFKFNRSGQSKRHRQNTGQIYIYRKQFNVCTCCWIIFEKKKLHTQKKQEYLHTCTRNVRRSESMSGKRKTQGNWQRKTPIVILEHFCWQLKFSCETIFFTQSIRCTNFEHTFKRFS